MKGADYIGRGSNAPRGPLPSFKNEEVLQFNAWCDCVDATFGVRRSAVAWDGGAGYITAIGCDLMVVTSDDCANLRANKGGTKLLPGDVLFSMPAVQPASVNVYPYVAMNPMIMSTIDPRRTPNVFVLRAATVETFIETVARWFQWCEAYFDYALSVGLKVKP